MEERTPTFRSRRGWGILRVAMGRIASLSLMAGCLAGCGAPPPGAPSAVVTSDPEAVCVGDGYRTDVTLDASESAPRLTLVPGASPADATLEYDWTLHGSPHVIVRGDTSSETLVVRMLADRPLHAELVVRESGGGVASTLHTVAVTEGPCDPEGGP